MAHNNDGAAILTAAFINSKDGTESAGATLIKFWESRNHLPASIVSSSDDDTAAASLPFKAPQSVAEADARLNNALFRNMVDPAFVPQLLQPLKVSHDIVPRVKRVLEQRTALEVLRAKLLAEGAQLRAAVGGPNDANKSGPFQQQQQDCDNASANSTEACSSAAILPTPSAPAATTAATKAGLLPHPDLAAWQKYEAETLAYIAAQHVVLDKHAKALKEAYQLWRSELDFFRAGLPDISASSE